VATEGAIRYRLRKLDLEGVQCAVNPMLKSKAIKTLPWRAPNEVADAGFSIKGLYLDKQFYTIDVINTPKGNTADVVWSTSLISGVHPKSSPYLQQNQKLSFIVKMSLPYILDSCAFSSCALFLDGLGRG